MSNFTLRAIKFTILLLFPLFTFAQIVVNSTATPAQMVSNIVGQGVQVSNIIYNGAAVASGTFTASGSNIGFASGVILSTGVVQTNATGFPVGANGSSFDFASTGNLTPGFPILNNLAGANTFDGVELQFDFIPETSPVSFRFIFGSEEYPEFAPPVSFGFNDAFAFLVSGQNPLGGNYTNQNVALIPGTSTPVSINNVNQVTNAGYYVTNNGNTCTYDAFTTPITAVFNVVPCSTYTIRLMIADGGDSSFDSAVFLEENSFGSAPFSITTSTISGDNNFYEACAPATVTFSRQTASTVPLTINYTVGGTATMGTDYSPIPNSVTIPAGQTSASLTLTGLADALNEGSETVVISVVTGCGFTNSITLNLLDKPIPTVTTNTPSSICSGVGSSTVTATASNGVGNFTYSWTNSTSTAASFTVTPSTTTTYTVTATDFCGSTATASATVNVSQTPSPPAISSNTPVCIGSTINLTAVVPAGIAVQWTGPSAFTSTSLTPSIPSATLANAGIYTCRANNNGCLSNPVTVIVNVINPPAAPAVSNNGPVCEGASLNLTGGAGPANTVYQWTGPNGYTASVQNPIIPSTSSASAGNYSLVLNINGCLSLPGTTSVVILPNPAAPTISSNSPICIGNTINLSAQNIAGAVYNWVGPNGFSSTSQNPSIPSSVAANGGDYSCSITLAGCNSPLATTNVAIISNAPPVISSNSPVCQFGSLNLSGPTGAGFSYAWTGPNGFTSTAQNPSINNILLNGAGNYQLITVNQGCVSNPSTLTVVVNPKPATPVATNTGPVCANNSPFTINTDFLAGASYNWTGPSGFSSTVQNPSIAGLAVAGSYTYSVTATVNNCQSDAGSTSVTVHPIPAAPTVSSNAPLCDGSNLQLTIDPVANATYLWSGPSGFTSTNQNPAINAATLSNNGAYSASVTVNNCTSPVAVANVIVHPIPVAPIPTSNSPVCENGLLGLNASFISGATYNWTGPNGFSSTLQTPSINAINGTNVGQYDLTITVNNCTSPVQSTVVAMTPLPIANAGPDLTICSNIPFQLGTAGLPGYTYNWFPSNYGVSNLDQPTFTVINQSGVPQTIQFTVVATNQGCTNTDLVVATIDSEPIAQFVQPPTQCLNDHSINLFAAGVFGPNATFNWQFEGDASIPSSTNANPTGIIWQTNGLKNVTLTITENGCTSMPFSLPIMIYPNPLVEFTSPLTEGCAPFKTTFNDQTLINSNGAIYEWSFGNGQTSGSTSPGHIYLAAGVYDVVLKVTNLEGCSDIMVKNNYINVYPNPDARFTFTPNEVDFVDPKIFINNECLEATNVVYNIIQNQQTIAQLDLPNVGFVFDESGLFTIQQIVTNEFGCKDTLNRPVDVKRNFSLYIPSTFSPNDDGLNDLFQVYGQDVAEYGIQIFNRWGQLLYTSYDIESGWDGTIRTSDKTSTDTFYTYVINAKDTQGRTYLYRGNVLLLK